MAECPQSEIHVGPDKLEVVALGDMLSAGGGCEITVTTRVKTAWKKFRGATTSSHIPSPLLQDPWPYTCIRFLRAECHAQCQ